MRRVHGVGFFSEGPVRSGFLELGDVTVLTGVNDSGKTRILALIETALSSPELGDLIDVFGIAAPGEVSMFLHHETDPRFRLDDLTEPAARFLEALESPGVGDEVRIGMRLSTFDQRFFAWRFGRSLAELD